MFLMMRLFDFIIGVVYGSIIALLPANLLWTLYLSVAASSAVIRLTIPGKIHRGSFFHTPFSIMVDALEWPGSALSRFMTISPLLMRIRITTATRGAILTLQPTILSTPIAMPGIVGILVMAALFEGTTVQYGELWFMFAFAGMVKLADIALDLDFALKQLRTSTRNVASTLLAAVLANIGLVLTAWAARVSSTSSILSSNTSQEPNMEPRLGAPDSGHGRREDFRYEIFISYR